MVNSMAYMNIDAVHYSDKIKRKCYGLFYHALQELDNRVLFEDDNSKLYYLGEHLHAIRETVFEADNACLLEDYACASLFNYTDEIRELILRKNAVCYPFGQ